MPTLKNKAYRAANWLLPKVNRVLVTGSDKMETNALEAANYIAHHYDIPVYIAVSRAFREYIEDLLHPDVHLIDMEGPGFLLFSLCSKYIFSTHGSSLAGSSSRQTEVNIWHGIPLKKIRLARGEAESGIRADVTVGTSDLTKKIFAECFGVPEESVMDCGYPRNDRMLRAKGDRAGLIELIQSVKLNEYNKVLFWMPTFRRKSATEMMNVRKGIRLDNPFEVEGFDIERFNQLLVEQNAICLLKPHYFYLTGNHKSAYSNILMIDDEWIGEQGINLYELIACTDIMITDFSSVMLDYTLLEQPVVCFCTDLEDYRKTQGLYFEDIANWIPGPLIQEQDAFFDYLKQLIVSGDDPYAEKSKEIRKRFFRYHDADSMKRLTAHVFSNKVKPLKEINEYR